MIPLLKPRINPLDADRLGRGGRHASLEAELWRRLKFDPILFFVTLALLVFGLLVIYSANPQGEFFVKHQLVSDLIGLLCLLLISRVDTAYHKNYLLYLYLLFTFLVVLTLLFGHQVNGSKRWLDLYFIRLQPSEFLKVVVPAYVADIVCRKPLPVKFKSVVFALFITLIPFFLTAMQPDLGTALLILSGSLCVIFLSGLSLRIIFLCLGALALVLPLAWFFLLHDYQKTRVLTFLYPESDPYGAGWQVLQSQIAFGSGGPFGKGFLQSSQALLDFLPESHTDFILAVIGEQFGFFGIFVLFSVYGLLIARAASIVLHSKSNYDRTLGGTFCLILLLYVVTNTGMVAGALPTVGVPLLLISYGGSSVLSITMMLGVLMSIHSHPKLR